VVWLFSEVREYQYGDDMARYRLERYGPLQPPYVKIFEGGAGANRDVDDRCLGRAWALVRDPS